MMGMEMGEDVVVVVVVEEEEVVEEVEEEEEVVEVEVEVESRCGCLSPAKAAGSPSHPTRSSLPERVMPLPQT